MRLVITYWVFGVLIGNVLFRGVNWLVERYYLDIVKSDFGIKYYDYLLLQSEKYREEDLLYIEEAKLKTTQKGKFLSDGISSDLFMLNLIQHP